MLDAATVFNCANCTMSSYMFLGPFVRSDVKMSFEVAFCGNALSTCDNFCLVSITDSPLRPETLPATQCLNRVPIISRGPKMSGVL